MLARIPDDAPAARTRAPDESLDGADLRVVLVAPAARRPHLRRRAAAAGLQVVGEAASPAEARTMAGADAWLLPAERSEAGVEPAAEPLTPREHDVLELLAEGLPNKAIARRLGISDQTVKFHVASISGKLGARNRTAAVRKAVSRGILTL